LIGNARREGDVINPDTKSFLELDIYIPSLQLAFEYQVWLCRTNLLFFLRKYFQDKHHYTSAEYVVESLKNVQARDAVKKEVANKKEITLITVPCWWDGQRDR